jgi:hypothetical protein
MAASELERAVARLAAVSAADDERLGRAWAWGAYRQEGARFAALRSCEELREHAVRAAHARQLAGRGPTQAQRILAQYHAAFRDLEGALAGLDEAALTLAPAEGEWPVRTAVVHMTEADAGFLVSIGYALGQHRAGNAEPGQPPEAYWVATLGDEAAYNAVVGGAFAELRAAHRELHDHILAAFAGIADDEIDLPSRYWEPEPMPLRFRLHRLESHLRQHTVQVDNTLAAIGRAPREGRRLARLLYTALADAEGAVIGAEGTLGAKRADLAAVLATRAEELAVVLA